jgi:hypothetical protein
MNEITVNRKNSFRLITNNFGQIILNYEIN